LSAISCRLLYQSASPHIQQLYTGFRLLHRSGFLRLSQEMRRTPVSYRNDAPHLADASHAHLDAVVGEQLRLHFDTHDSQELALGELASCDFYFKRSYLPAAVEALPANERGKVIPLGLNYRVLPGWKMAEYVAFSKAILSERLVYETPGSFAPGKNYIEFTSPEECLNGAVRLIEDVALRQQLMRSNAAYYRDYLRPDALVRNALKIAIEKGAQG